MTMAAKTDRIEARIDPEQRALLEEAAAARGQSLSDFVIGVALSEAESLTRSMHITVVPPEFVAEFERLLGGPPDPDRHRRLAEYEPLLEEPEPA